MTGNRHAVRRCAQRGEGSAAGFTRLELLTVLGVLTLVVIATWPALARPGPAGQSATCLENVRRLTLALALYANDAQDYLPPNPADGNMTPHFNWVGGSAGTGGAQEFNPDILMDAQRSLLSTYLESDPAVWRCPSDPRAGRYTGSDPALRGQIVPAARTYAMNLAVGTDPYTAGGKRPVHGSWLDGNHAHVRGQTWFTFARTTEFRNPGPSRTFVLLDEDHRSVNDGAFALVGPMPGRQNYRMIDWPATYHEFGGTFGFADGHGETHAWKDARTQLKGVPMSTIQPGNVDIAWMAEHATALIRQPQLAVTGPPSRNAFDVFLSGTKGAGYVLEYRDSLTLGGWTPLPSVTAPTNGPLQLTDPAADSLHRFYRVWTP